mmetsp:Transcript_15027/g.42742  ORF Transcript_15027/g.42742 Transcript_15027/m.42742 type:complete len:432 (-) Transcript_15027:475-1770(-)
MVSALVPALGCAQDDVAEVLPPEAAATENALARGDREDAVVHPLEVLGEGMPQGAPSGYQAVQWAKGLAGFGAVHVRSEIGDESETAWRPRAQTEEAHEQLDNVHVLAVDAPLAVEIFLCRVVPPKLAVANRIARCASANAHASDGDGLLADALVPEAPLHPRAREAAEVLRAPLADRVLHCAVRATAPADVRPTAQRRLLRGIQEQEGGLNSRGPVRFRVLCRLLETPFQQLETQVAPIVIVILLAAGAHGGDEGDQEPAQIAQRYVLIENESVEEGPVEHGHEALDDAGVALGLAIPEVEVCEGLGDFPPGLFVLAVEIGEILGVDLLECLHRGILAIRPHTMQAESCEQCAGAKEVQDVRRLRSDAALLGEEILEDAALGGFEFVPHPLPFGGHDAHRNHFGLLRPLADILLLLSAGLFQQQHRKRAQ